MSYDPDIQLLFAIGRVENALCVQNKDRGQREQSFTAQLQALGTGKGNVKLVK